MLKVILFNTSLHVWIQTITQKTGSLKTRIKTTNETNTVVVDIQKFRNTIYSWNCTNVTWSSNSSMALCNQHFHIMPLDFLVLIHSFLYFCCHTSTYHLHNTFAAYSSPLIFIGGMCWCLHTYYVYMHWSLAQSRRPVPQRASVTESQVD